MDGGWIFRFLLAIAIATATANTLAAGEPVVTVVMMYSPTCPHCHDIITTVLPPLEEQYGDDLAVVLINADTREGNQLFWSAMDWLQIPEEEQGVPVILVGPTVLVGGEHSTARLPEVVASAMARGGTALPELPGLREMVAQGAGVGTGDAPLTVADMSIAERLGLDPLGSTVALAALGLMAASVVIVVDAWWKAGPAWDGAARWQVFAVPLLALAGLGVAAYLAYVEITDTSAVCGPVGHCNTVQQSTYARLFGVLPIGVLGVLGYVAILLLWVFGRVAPSEWRRRTRWMLPSVILLGVLFSTYLTFLEPFVIGAVCMWCVTSAVVMTALLWSTAPIGAISPAVRRVGSAPTDQALEAEPGPTVDPGRPVERKTVTRGGRLKTVVGYVLAAVIGVVVAALIVHYGKTLVFPPAAVSSVAEANRRAAVENAVLVAGLVVGPAVWHAVRAARRERTRLGRNGK